MPRRGTPDELDEFFVRDIIDEDDYRDFWPRWWKASKAEREEIIRELSEQVEEQQYSLGEVYDGGEPLEFKIHKGSKGREIAEREAKHAGYRVVRRNASGSFSKRGNHWQAVRNPRK